MSNFPYGEPYPWPKSPKIDPPKESRVRPSTTPMTPDLASEVAHPPGGDTCLKNVKNGVKILIYSTNFRTPDPWVTHFQWGMHGRGCTDPEIGSSRVSSRGVYENRNGFSKNDVFEQKRVKTGPFLAEQSQNGQNCHFCRYTALSPLKTAILVKKCQKWHKMAISDTKCVIFW